MSDATLHIKNMVCNRCIRVVQEELDNLGLGILDIELGKVTLDTPPNEQTLTKIRNMLNDNGFELIDNKKSRIIDHIKTLIIEVIHHGKEGWKSGNTSNYIAERIGYDYSYLSNLFSSVEGITIEKYIINQKIERAKELLVYDELSLKEIAYELEYSSVQHLSNQFKKVTGLTPSHFKKMKDTKRTPLDKV